MMKLSTKPRHWLALLLVAGQVLTAEEVSFEKRGDEILKEIVSEEWAKAWKDSSLDKVRLVKQKSDLSRPTGLLPVWVANIDGPGEKTGMVMWDAGGDGKLVEFTLDAELQIGGAISEVPNLQQFPVDDGNGGKIASGCVPTAAGSVLAFWAERKYPEWKGEDGKTVKGLTSRLRKKLKMTPFPDTDGFTTDGMSLAGAFPHHLAAAIRNDAVEKGVEIDCQISRFSFDDFKEEVKASRPVLLSCFVRVPHKPELSWGHQVVGVSWTEVDGVKLIGLVDNFYPTNSPKAIRWIRKDAFHSMITVKPSTRKTE